MTGPLPSMALWSQNVLEHIVGHAAALRDALGFVERPVDTEIDAALPVFFLRLRQGGEATLHFRPHLSIVALIHTVEFVRDEGEWDAVGSIVVAQHLKERPAEPCM